MRDSYAFYVKPHVVQGINTWLVNGIHSLYLPCYKYSVYNYKTLLPLVNMRWKSKHRVSFPIVAPFCRRRRYIHVDFLVHYTF